MFVWCNTFVGPGPFLDYCVMQPFDFVIVDDAYNSY
jgi:hypothetical protein